MSSIRRAFRTFCHASATDRLVSWCGVHITKIHVYGVTAGGLSFMDFHEGRHGYGLGVLVLAFLDLKDDV